MSSSGSDLNGWSIYSGTYSKDYTYWPSMIFGVFGFMNNSFFLIILYSQQKTPHLTILKSMALADAGVSLTLIVLTNVPTTYKVPVSFLGNFACCVFFSTYISFSLSATSAWHLVWLTLDLYGGQSDCKWYQFLFGSKLRIRLSLLFLWVLGFVIMNNNLWNYYVDGETQTCYLTWRSDTLRHFLGIEKLILVVILPLGIMLACYFSLFKKLLEAKNYYRIKRDTIRSSENNQLHNAAKTFLKSMSIRTSLLLLVFLLSWIPTQIIWQGYVFKLVNNTVFQTWYGKTAEVMPFLNAALNPIIYGWSWFEFREAVKEKLHFQRIPEPNNIVII